ncbi:hypothetical protein [Chitinophaga varians]|uniref:hypothetical protein n=1 Tax=Chitinophaga varians TaxID=2202339 RepID=UPI00165F6441|nr:hypothetical protein [Chitinophaga varians]MBC9913186.1 hypothetical protein [Chitinophaga varians]
MITTLKAIDAIWKLLNDSALRTEVSGGVYKLKRPINSQREDVVVNSLPFDSLQLQKGIINVNIHVPNLVITANGIQDTTQPDFVRLSELASIAAPLLTDSWNDEWHFDVQQHTVIEEAELREHFVNFRLEFYAINL